MKSKIKVVNDVAEEFARMGTPLRQNEVAWLERQWARKEKEMAKKKVHRLGISASTRRVHAGVMNVKNQDWLQHDDVHNDFLTCIIQLFAGKPGTVLCDQNGKEYTILVKVNETKQEEEDNGA